jgi:prolyl-tRNA synthetase
MRLSRFYAPTLKETPADAEVVSHQLMLRAGMIRLLSRGTYDFLPLGLRVVRKIENIVREELDRAGANEVLMPIVQPAELWRETGRWDGYIQEGLLANFKDRTGRELCLAPTAEEVVTDLVRKDVQSFRELPLNLYQINWKFRDEIRPRFGLMRGREFLMMDAYSFDRDVKSAHAAYWKMYEAYKKAFTRCGLEFRPVEAATGQIGGNMSHEFQVLAETGEDAIAACEKCEYAANLELAEIAKDRKVEIDPASLAKLEKVATPGKKTIADVCAFLGMPEDKSIKTLVYETDKGLVMALLRGDHELAPEKLKKAAQAKWVKPAAEADVESKVGPVGFLGPVNPKSKVDVFADRALEFATNLVMGANESDTHYKNANPGRDFTPTKYADLRVAKAGDRCPRCAFDNKETGAAARHGTFQIKRGIEVGHVFYLGTKYSSAMKAEFKEESGKTKPFEMGCYGIGITRVAAAAVEQNHDKDGILWPTPIAPFQVLVLSASTEKKEIVAAADRIYDALAAKGIDVLYDDRAIRGGPKFKDADLIGIPYRIVVGEQSLAEGQVEVKSRRGGVVEKMAPEAAIEWAVSKVKADLARR